MKTSKEKRAAVRNDAEYGLSIGDKFARAQLTIDLVDDLEETTNLLIRAVDAFETYLNDTAAPESHLAWELLDTMTQELAVVAPNWRERARAMSR